MEPEQLSAGIRAALNRARLSSAACLTLPAPDLIRQTGLSLSDVRLLVQAAARNCRSHGPRPALQCGSIPSSPCLSLGGPCLSLGCPRLDALLRGGLPSGALTELAGESGAGKTQLALQLCLSVQYPTEYGGLDSGAVYVSTEDSFPIRRLQQLIRGQSSLRSDVPAAITHTLRLSDGVYVEHAADLEALQLCLTRRVPLLLAQRKVRLVVVDSVAALFRSEFQACDWLERSKQLLSFSSTLHQLSREHNATILCVNQVTDVFSDSEHSLGPLSSSVGHAPSISPALGLLWANQITVRLMMLRCQETVTRGDQSSVLRRLEVVFAPHLSRGRCVCGGRGVRGVP